MPPPAALNCSHVCIESFFFFFFKYKWRALMLFLNSTTFGTFTLILYEESGEHLSFSFPPTVNLPVSPVGGCQAHPAFFAVKSPTGMFDYLRRVRHTQSCQTFCGNEKVWPSGRNQTWLIRLFLQSQKPFLSPHSPSLIARVNITDFYFPLFTFYYRVVYISSPLILSMKQS